MTVKKTTEQFKNDIIEKCGAIQKRSMESLINETGCLNCEDKHGIKKTPQQFKQELEEIYGLEYEPLEDYVDSNTSILIRHNLCGKIYKTKPHHLLTQKGGTCPICRKASKGERRIRSFLEKNNISFEEQKRFEGFRRYPYDFFLPEYNLLIEFQGVQHFQPVSRFGGKPAFERIQENDKNKKAFAFENKYDFLEILYNQYDNIEQILVQRLSCGRE